MSRTRLSAFCLTAALTATTATALTTAAGTASAAETKCGEVVHVFTVQADGDLWFYGHKAPETGEFNWVAEPQQVGSGWSGRTFAGAEGRMYNITDSGELRRLRYNGSSWDMLPDGSQYETIGWGWQKYLEAGNRGRITIDANGVIYTLDGDLLRWWHYDEIGKNWSSGSGQTLDTGWSRFDVIAASGSGGLQARDRAGMLHRFRYDIASERFVAYQVVPQTMWRGQDKLFSAGGDVYYAVRADTGELLWNRFSEDETSNWSSDTGSVIGTGWGSEVDVTATTTDCGITGLHVPTKPQVWQEKATPTRIITPTAGHIHLVNMNAEHEIVDRHWAGTSWASKVVGGDYGGVSPAVTIDEATGSALIGGTELETGDVELNTLVDGRWQGFQSLKGALEGAPAIARRSDGTLAVYAVATQVGGTNRLYVREQMPNGDFLPWRPFGQPCTQLAPVPVVITHGDVTTIVMQTGSGKWEWFRQKLGSSPVRMGTLPAGGGKVALTADANGILAFAVQRPAADADASVVMMLREKADHSGFEDAWKPLPSGPVIDGDDIAAEVLPNGTVAVSVTDKSHKVHVTTSTAAGSTEFNEWQLVTAADQVEFSAQTSLHVTKAGKVMLAAMDTKTTKQHVFTASIPDNPATPLTFTSLPID